MTEAGATVNPFPGLRPFREDEEYLFFGRESQVDAIIDKLAATHFLAVLGTSGCGKSSLVNCGLRPALHRGSMGSAGTAWRMAQFRPGSDPLRAMAGALAQDGVLFDSHGAASPAGAAAPFAGASSVASTAPTLEAVIETTLRLSKLGLIDIVEQARLAPGVNLLLVVDQFEELFRYRQLDPTSPLGVAGGADTATVFVNLLLQVRECSDCAIYVVLTMRSDFLGDCTRLPGLAEAINAGQYLVPRMTRDERRAAIAGPIGVGGAHISPVLLTRLVNDVGDNPDQLSILQHALNRTWAAWWADSGGVGPIERRHYQAIGTMAEALDRHAEAAYAELGSDRERAICERLFKALTDQANDPRGVRRPTRLAALCALADATPAEIGALIEVFREPSRSFLMPPATEALQAETVVDISHESLMRIWQRLRNWAGEEALSAQHFRRIAEAATLNAAQKSSLWRDPELQLALDWQGRQQPTEQWAACYGYPWASAQRFVEDSAAAREVERDAARRKLAHRRWLLGGVVAVLVGIGLVFFGLWQSAQVALVEAIAARTVMQSRAMLDASDFTGLDKALLVIAAGHRLRPDNQTYTGLQYAAEKTARLRQVLALPDSVIAFSPDQRSAVAVHEGTLRVWDTATGKPLTAPMQGHASTVNAAAFSPDGLTLVSAGDGATLRLWDVRTGEPRSAPLGGQDGRVWSVAFSPDGKTIVSGREDATLRLLDAVSGAPRGDPLRGHTYRVWSVAFSPDGRTVVSGSDDASLRLWDAKTGAAQGPPLLGHTGVVSSVAFSPDGSTLVSGGGDNSVRLWDARTGQPRGAPLLGHTSRIWNVAFSPDGKSLVSGSEDQTLRVWDATTGQARGPALQGHKSRVWRVAFSADGRSVISASGDHTLARWDAAAPSPPGAPARGHLGAVRSIALSPDGKTLVSGGDDSTLRLWDAPTRQPRGPALRGHDAAVTSVAFSPDGKVIASASEDGTLRLWDAASGQVLGASLRGHTDRVWSVAFSPDGKTIASGSGDATVRLWDVASGQARGAPLHGHSKRVWSVAFSPDGRTIASASDDSTLRLWDVATGQPRGSPLLGHFQRVWVVAFSPDGKTLASGGEDSTVRLWDAASGRALGDPLVGHLEAVTSIAFSLDGRTLASGSDDATLRYWDVATGQARGAPVRGHEAALSSVVFNADGKTLVSASEDATLRWWDAPDSWIDRICAKVARNLSRAQWQHWVGDIAYVPQCPGLPIPPD